MGMEKKKWQVTKVRHLVTRSGQMLGHCNSDMVFIDGAPFVVLEWGDYPDGESVPLVTVQLDPKQLDRLDWDEAEYMYQSPIEDPVRHN